jgi:hypothetical protein
VNEAHLIDMRRRLRKQIAAPRAALPVLLELKPFFTVHLSVIQNQALSRRGRRGPWTGVTSLSHLGAGFIGSDALARSLTGLP